MGALVASGITVSVLKSELKPQPEYSSIAEHQTEMKLTDYRDSAEIIVPEGINFITASQRVTPGVVHIRSLYSDRDSDYSRFFRGPSQSSGSGVVISDDGFIATNYHVIEDANEIEVVFTDNRSYLAKVIGQDPTTDLALLKIDAQNLQFVPYGNSDDIVPGEWVLAIGNPFDLNSTVTAGIVSAKARNIGILSDRVNNLQIESFIQTDAAVNPGNSGGALVNLKGELIGINTAIATSTGNFAGYSFAVPVTLVKKVMDDLFEFGEVQRGLLGIRIADVDARLAEARDLSVVNGVFVSSVNENSAAEEAGILAGDVITNINGKKVNNVSELQEIVARNRPGDDVKVTYLREGQYYNVDATLRNFQGNTELERRVFSNLIEGATFKPASDRILRELDVEYGIEIVQLDEGKWKEAGMEEGVIITAIDKLSVNSIEDLHLILENKSGGILVEGFDKDGKKKIYGVDW